MAETVVINIEANTQGLQSTIDLLTKLGAVEKSTAEEFKRINEANTASLQKAASTTAKEFDKAAAAIKNVKADNGLAKSLDITKEVAAFGNGMKSIKAQLREAVNEAQALAEKFGELDPRTLAAAKRAAELKDAIGDVNAQIQALTPEGKFLAIQKAGSAVAGAFQVATGALQAFGVENEAATKLAQEFQGALNIFAGLGQLTQLKDAYIAVKAAIGVSTAAKVVDTAVTESETAATVAATAAQKGLNLAVLANPYVIAAAALAGVVTALIAFSNSAEEAEKKQEALNRTILASQEFEKTFAKEIDRLSKERINDLDTQIAIRKTEGASVREISKLEREKIDVQLNALKALKDQKEKQQEKDSKDAATAIALATEEGVAKYNELTKQKADRADAIKAIESQEKILANQIKVLNAETTADIKKENQDRIDDAKETRDKLKKLTLENALEDIRKRYADERIEAGKLYTDKESYAIADTEITQRELKEQLELFKDNKEKYQEILLKLQAFTRTIDLTPVVKTPKITKDTTDGGLLSPEDSKALQDGLDEGERIRAANRAKEIEGERRKNEAIKELKQEAVNFAVNTVQAQLDKAFEDQLDTIEEQKQAQLEAITEEEDALLESYENRRIGKRELEEAQKKLTLDRVATEKKAEKELNEIRRKQDIAKRAIALFDIALNTYRSVMAITADITIPFTAKPELVAAAIALGGIQAAGVLAQPLPKYKKGTLSVPGVGSDDSQLSLLQPGEAVIPTDTNRRYKSAISAIYHNKINPEEMNRWVTMRLKGSMSDTSDRAVTARLDTSDLYSLSRMMKKNDGVYVKNIGELAAVFESLSNPRR